jgi:hypothetical protein
VCNQSKNTKVQQKKKTITRTFRIKDDWDLILHEEAKRQNISVNVLIDKILRRYAFFGRYADRIDILNLPNRTFKEIIQFVPDDRLAKEGEKFGSLDAVDFFNSLGYPRNYDTFIYLITEHFGSPKFARWFQCFYHPLETQDLFHLQHNLGRKWSVFVGNYLRTILKTIINTKVDLRIYDFAVTLKVSRPQKLE